MLTFWKAHLNTCQTLDCVIKNHVLDHCEYNQKDISNRVQIPLYKPQKNNDYIKFWMAITTPWINGKLLDNLSGTWYLWKALGYRAVSNPSLFNISSEHLQLWSKELFCVEWAKQKQMDKQKSQMLRVGKTVVSSVGLVCSPVGVISHLCSRAVTMVAEAGRAGM